MHSRVRYSSKHLSQSNSTFCPPHSGDGANHRAIPFHYTHFLKNLTPHSHPTNNPTNQSQEGTPKWQIPPTTLSLIHIFTSKDGGCEPQEQSDSERVDSRDAERFAGFGEPAGREATCEGLNIRV